MELHDVPPAEGRSPGLGVLYRALVGRIGRRTERSIVMNLLVDASELPGQDWANSREASFHSVRSPFQRSPYLRCVTASRNYRQGTPVRYLYIEIALMESSADADSLVERSRTRIVQKPGVEITAERELSDYALPAVMNSRAWEVDTVRGSLGGTNRKISARVGGAFFAVHAGPSGGGWDWADVMTFATIQAEKIARLPPAAGDKSKGSSGAER